MYEESAMYDVVCGVLRQSFSYIISVLIAVVDTIIDHSLAVTVRHQL